MSFQWPRGFSAPKEPKPWKEFRKHDYYPDGKMMRCYVTEGASNGEQTWYDGQRKLCNVHESKKIYRSPELWRVTDCGEYECCTDHHREKKLWLEFFKLGKATGTSPAAGQPVEGR